MTTSNFIMATLNPNIGEQATKGLHSASEKPYQPYENTGLQPASDTPPSSPRLGRKIKNLAQRLRPGHRDQSPNTRVTAEHVEDTVVPAQPATPSRDSTTSIHQPETKPIGIDVMIVEGSDLSTPHNTIDENSPFAKHFQDVPYTIANSTDRIGTPETEEIERKETSLDRRTESEAVAVEELAPLIQDLRMQTERDSTVQPGTPPIQLSAVTPSKSPESKLEGQQQQHKDSSSDSMHDMSLQRGASEGTKEPPPSPEQQITEPDEVPLLDINGGDEGATPLIRLQQMLNAVISLGMNNPYLFIGLVLTAYPLWQLLLRLSTMLFADFGPLLLMSGLIAMLATWGGYYLYRGPSISPFGFFAVPESEMNLLESGGNADDLHGPSEPVSSESIEDLVHSHGQGKIEEGGVLHHFKEKVYEAVDPGQEMAGDVMFDDEGDEELVVFQDGAAAANTSGYESDTDQPGAVIEGVHHEKGLVEPAITQEDKSIITEATDKAKLAAETVKEMAHEAQHKVAQAVEIMEEDRKPPEEQLLDVGRDIEQMEAENRRAIAS